MDDLAESVIKHLSVTNGKGPCAAVCSVAQEYGQRATFAVVLPVTKDSILSFNVDFVNEQPNINNRWEPHASFNVATVEEVVESPVPLEEHRCSRQGGAAHRGRPTGTATRCKASGVVTPQVRFGASVRTTGRNTQRGRTWRQRSVSWPACALRWSLDLCNLCATSHVGDAMLQRDVIAVCQLRQRSAITKVGPVCGEGRARGRKRDLKDTQTPVSRERVMFSC